VNLQGLIQAQSITTKLGLPEHVLPDVLNSGYMRVIQALISNAAVKPSDRVPLRVVSDSKAVGLCGNTTTWKLHAANSKFTPVVSNRSSECQRQVHAMHGAYDDASQQNLPAGVGAAAMPSVGSAEWISQLQKIRQVCQKAQVDHTLIDGFLAASCQQVLQPHTNTSQTDTDVSATNHVCETPLKDECDQENTQQVEEIGHSRDALERWIVKNIQEVLMNTDLVEEDYLLTA
jgi:hypothetical protein